MNLSTVPVVTLDNNSKEARESGQNTSSLDPELSVESQRKSGRAVVLDFSDSTDEKDTSVAAEKDQDKPADSDSKDDLPQEESSSEAEASEANPDTESDPPEEESRSSKYSRRIQRKNEQIRRLEEQNREYLARLAELEKTTGKYQEKSHSEPDSIEEINPEDYNTQREYMAAVARAAYRQEQRQAERAKQQAQAKKVQQDISARLTDAEDYARDRYSDYEEAVGETPDLAGPVIIRALTDVEDVEVRGEMMYYLGTRPELVEELNGLSEYRAAKRLAEIEAQLAQNLPGKKKGSSPAKKPVIVVKRPHEAPTIEPVTQGVNTGIASSTSYQETRAELLAAQRRR